MRFLVAFGSRNVPKNVLARSLCSKKDGDEKQKNNDKKQKTGDQKQENGEKDKTDELPEAPTTCCMSGCPNCVWLEYAEKLSEYFKDGGEKAMQEMNEKITDENIKAFIMHEWRMRQKK